MPYEFPKPLGNGPLVEVFPNIWAVEGYVYPVPGARMTRNMTIIKQGDKLCVVNSLRLMPEQEAEMEKLGTVKHLVRLCVGHGMDDPYFVDKYKPTLWEAGAGMPWADKEITLKADKVLGEDGAPFPEIVTPLIFSSIKEEIKGDASLIVASGDTKVLVASDSVMCYGKHKDDTKLSTLSNSLLGKVALWMLGFAGRVNTVPEYFKHHSPDGKASGILPDLENLAAADWDAVIPPHGNVVKAGAREIYRQHLAKIKKGVKAPTATPATAQT